MERGGRHPDPVRVPAPSQEPLAPSVVQVPTWPTHSSVRVRLLFEEQGAAGVCFGPGFAVGVLNRPGGGRVYVLADPVSVSAKAHRELAAACVETRAGRSPALTYPTSRFVHVIRLGDQPVQVDLTVD